MNEDDHDNSIVKMYFAHRPKKIRYIRCDSMLILTLSKLSGYCRKCRRFIREKERCINENP